MPKFSSRAMTSSTVSSESAPRSSTKEALGVISSFVHAELLGDDLLHFFPQSDFFRSFNVSFAFSSAIQTLRKIKKGECVV